VSLLIRLIDGNLIFHGKDLQIVNAFSKTYKLEVIATLDGCKDYPEVSVKIKPGIIESIDPNPATNTINVNYKLNGVSSAYLMVLGPNYNTISNNYILDTNSNQTTINIINYRIGIPTVSLVVNGKIVDAKTVVKN